MKERNYYRCLISTTILALIGVVTLSLLPQQTAHVLADTLPNEARQEQDPNTEPAQDANWPPCEVIPGEVILFGSEEDIQELLTSLAPETLELKQSTSVKWIKRLPGAKGGDDDDDDDDNDEYEDPFVVSPQSDDNAPQLNLYTIADNTDVEDIVQRSISIAQAQSPELDVIVAPNCRTSGHGHSARGSPAIPLGPQASPEEFLTQPALEVAAPGLGLYNETRRVVEPTGAGVRVAVLDTSPFSDTVPNGTVAQQSITLPGLAQASTSLPDLNLRVSHAITIAELESSGSYDSIANHGLFAATQIHAVAPESDISLYRVLDDQGNGDMYTVSAAVSDFISTTLALEHPAHCSVINMSLGIVERVDDPAAMEPLYTTLREAHDLGITIVASAGNDSATTRFADTMNQPASYPFTLGVTASDDTGDRACYANSGDIAAPGGDSGLGCKGVSESDYVVSLVRNPDRSMSYARWAGTSFAAPWVSGLAALIQEQESCRPSPERVAEMIAMGALKSSPDLGEGIITLPDSMIDDSPFNTPNPVDNTPVFLPLVQRQG